jgi:Tfp pilus assembly PilM family ATPase
VLLARSAAWGVDLTGGAVRAVHVERRGARFRVVDAIVQPISPAGEGAELLRPHLPDTVGRGLTDLVQWRRATLTDPVFIAFPALGAKQGRIEVPGRDPAQVRGLIEFELHHALKSDLEPWLLQRGTPERQSQGTVAVEFTAHRRELVNNFVSDLRRFGVPIDGLVPGPLALARYAEIEWPMAPNHRQLILEAQRTRTDLVYTSPHGPRFRTLPFGAGTLEETGAPDPKEIERLATQLHREHLLAHRALFGAHDGTALERIVLLGDGARHDELRRALLEKFQVAVVSPPSTRRFTADEQALGESTRHVLHYGTALGLAVAALSRAGESGSLVPPPKTRRALRRLPALSAALLLIALGLLASRFLAEREVARLEDLSSRLREGIRWTASGEWESARERAQSAAKDSKRLLDRAAALRRELGFPGRLLTALSESSLGCRLVSLEIATGPDADEATLQVETGNRSPSFGDRLKEQLEKHAGVTVASVEAAPAPANALVVLTVKLTLLEPEAGP